MRNYSEAFTVMSGKTDTGIGTPFNMGDYRHVVVLLSSASSANFTVKAVGTIVDGSTKLQPPDFTAAQSASAPYEFIQMVDLQNGSAINGDTGVAFAGTDDVRMFEINVNGMKWLNFRITAISAGSVTVKVMGFND